MSCGCGSHVAGPASGASGTSAWQTLDEVEWGRSVHGLAAAGSSAGVARLLARSPALAGARDAHGYAPLHYAARAGHVEVCSALLRAGACPHLATAGAQTTALHRACMGLHVGVVQLLLQHGADVRALDARGWTAAQHLPGGDEDEARRNAILAVLERAGGPLHVLATSEAV